VATHRPAPATGPSADGTPEPTTSKPDPITPTDYAIASVRVSNNLLPLLQRRITVGVSARNTGRAATETVTVSLAFQHAVRFDGVVSPGWSCGGAVPDQWLRTLTCSTRLAAGQGTTFVADTGDLVHSAGTVSVSAPGDPRPTNNAVSFGAGLWPLM
jgi:hypothetical protein